MGAAEAARWEDVRREPRLLREASAAGRPRWGLVRPADSRPDKLAARQPEENRTFAESLRRVGRRADRRSWRTMHGPKRGAPRGQLPRGPVGRSQARSLARRDARAPTVLVDETLAAGF